MTETPEDQLLTGDEPLLPGLVLADFWRWAMNDLQMNTTRGFLAEYLVAQAVGSEATHRVEWDVFDVLAADGTRIEVKSSGYLQSWSPGTLSTPRWGFKAIDTTRIWNEELGKYVDVDPAERVDVWVFALQSCRTAEEFNPVDVGQWRFWAVGNRRLLDTETRTIGVGGLERLAGQHGSFDDLRALIDAAKDDNEKLVAQ